MRRVVITGLGIVSSIGNNAEEVTESLRTGRSGIVAAPDYAELGFRSQVKGSVKMDGRQWLNVYEETSHAMQSTQMEVLQYNQSGGELKGRGERVRKRVERIRG